MSRNKKLLTVLLSVIFCLSAFTIAAYAVDADGDGYDDVTGEPVIIATEPYVEPTTPVEPTYAPVQDPDPAPTYAVDTQPDYNYSDNSSSNYYDNNDTNNYNSNNNSESSQTYVGGGQTYPEVVSTAPSAALYNSDRNIDSNELSNGDWSDIAANLKNASSTGTDSDDFGFIKNNEDTADNGDWMLIVGIVCLILSAAGITYVIASSVIRRKKLKNGGAALSSDKRMAAAGAGNYRSRQDYDDGYKQSSKRNQQKSPEKRYKYDTAEVKLPKSSQNGTRYKNNNSNGKRYK